MVNTIDVRGDVFNIQCYEDDAIPVEFQVSADWSSATVTLTIKADATVYNFTHGNGITVRPNMGFTDSRGTVGVKPGFSLVTFAKPNSTQWDAMVAAASVSYELRYQLDGDSRTPVRGDLTITRRITS